MRGTKYSITATAILLCAVMVLVACAPLTIAQAGDSHLIIKGERGPRASAVTWEFRTMADSGVWQGEIQNNGLRSLVVEVADNTSGVPEPSMDQRIRFAAYSAFPTGTVWTNEVLMSANSIYEITAIPNGPRGSSAIVIDHFTPAQPPIAIFTYSVVGATVTVDASTSSDPDGTVVSYAWDWGDGTSDTGVMASHTYTATDWYTITLTVTDNMGLTNSSSQLVYAEVPKYPPNASFTYSTDQRTVSVDASGSTDSDGTIVSYDWSWGDLTTGSGMTATHTYAADGIYEVILTVTDNDGLSDTANAMVEVSKTNQKPVAVFTYTVSDMTVTVDGSGSYDPDVGGFITTYDWNWGDGAVDTGMTASHTYAAYATYTISLIVTDDLGATGSTSQSVKLNAPPVASFTATVSGMTVDVDASGSTDDGTIVSYDWLWGDGNAGSGKTASHAYADYGTYTITLTIIDDGGKTSTVSKSVDIVNYPPVAAFTWTVSLLTVSFDASGSTDEGTIVSYAWDFGDGMTGSGKTVSHTYADYGIYTVSLTVTDNGGMTGSVSHPDVNVANNPPVAAFTYTVSVLTVNVDASGSTDDGTIVSYAWDWGDASTGSGMTATHTYAAYGIYTVQLTVTDDGGLTNSISKQVDLANTPPIASFTATVDKMTVSVDASASSDPDGTIVSYAWNWGDGSAAGSGKTATHTYATYGTKTITLTVTDNGGATASATKDVDIVNVPPTASFTTSVTLRTVSVDASASSDSDGTIASYAWAWGDGSTGTGMTATHTYATVGIKSITLTVTDNGGATATATKSVTIVNAVPTASFTSSVALRTVSVDASASSDPDGTIASYAWNWGDGSGAGSGKTTTHTYTLAGTYTITLTVTDNDGATATATKSVTIVNLLPTASFTATVTLRSVSVDASASSDSDGTIASYAWQWGDGATGTGKTATHSYALGTFTITLTVTDNEGGTGTTTKSVTIVNTPPTASFTATVTLRSVSVDASASSDPDGTVASYAWNWGDGATGTGKTASHTYTSAGGTFTITLTVTDNDGATGATTKSVTIAPNAKPVASFTSSTTLRTVSVDASASSDSDGTISTYAWQWGDGATGTGKTASHTYALGTYTITLTVTDNEAGTGTATKSVTIVNAIPTASFTTSVTLRSLSVDASASSDSDGTVASYAWNWGDGSAAGSGKTATHTYAPAGGTFTVTLTVTDNDGGTGTATKSVTITPDIAPVASFTVTVADLVVDVDGSASSDSDGTIAGYAWNWGDATTGSGMIATHTYAADGTYTITLTVTDNEGVTGTATQDVTLSSKSPKVTVTISNMFELYLKYATPLTPDYSKLGRWTTILGYNSWMDLRKPNYNEWMVSKVFPFTMSYGPYSTQTVPEVDMGAQLCSWYRMYVDAKNIPGAATGPGKDPFFVPVMSGDLSLPGGWVNTTWYSTYLTTKEMRDIRSAGYYHYANTFYGVPKSVTPLYTSDDGYWHEFQGLMSFTRDACKKFLGMTATGDLEDEFDLNYDLINGMWFDDWMAEGSGGGAYDIYTAYDFPNDIRWLQVIADPALANSDPNTLHLRIWAVSWGIDVLLWRYIEAAGLLKSWQAWADDWYLNLTIGPEMMDLEMRAVNGYQLAAATDEGGFTGAAWNMEAMHLDWCGNTVTHNSYISQYTPYDPEQTDGVLKMNGAPGAVNWGKPCSYAVAPTEMDLVAGEKWIFRLSTIGPVVGYPPYAGTSDVLSDAKIAEYFAHSTTGSLVMGTGWPTNLNDYYDPGTNSLILIGPLDFPRAVNPDWPALLAEGTPTIMFNVV